MLCFDHSELLCVPPVYEYVWYTFLFYIEPMYYSFMLLFSRRMLHDCIAYWPTFFRLSTWAPYISCLAVICVLITLLQYDFILYGYSSSHIWRIARQHTVLDWDLLAIEEDYIEWVLRVSLQYWPTHIDDNKTFANINIQQITPSFNRTLRLMSYLH